MEWWVWLIITIVIILIAWTILNKRKEEDIFESAGNRLKSLGACCRKIGKFFGGNA